MLALCNCAYSNSSEKTRGNVERDSTGNEVRTVDPIEYVYSAEGHYYLITLDKTTPSGTKTPRIDRMEDVRALPNTRAGRLTPAQKRRVLDMYRRSFGMFEKNAPIPVTLSMKEGLVKCMVDRFGQEATLSRTSLGRSEATVRVSPSDNFYSWVTQFGGDVVITSPTQVVEGMRSFLKRNAEKYREN